MPQATPPLYHSPGLICDSQINTGCWLGGARPLPDLSSPQDFIGFNLLHLGFGVLFFLQSKALWLKGFWFRGGCQIQQPEGNSLNVPT